MHFLRSLEHSLKLMRKIIGWNKCFNSISVQFVPFSWCRYFSNLQWMNASFIFFQAFWYNIINSLVGVCLLTSWLSVSGNIEYLLHYVLSTQYSVTQSLLLKYISEKANNFPNNPSCAIKWGGADQPSQSLVPLIIMTPKTFWKVSESSGSW